MIQLYQYLAEYIEKKHNNEIYWQRLYIRTVRILVKCLAKDYANPLNNLSMGERIQKMRSDLSAPEFQTALQNCRYKGHDFKFKVILFLLKHKMYTAAIFISQSFGSMRRLKNKVS